MSSEPGVPLAPSGGQARSWLQHELLNPAYHRSNPLRDFLDWLERLWTNNLGNASGAPPLATAAALLVVLLLVVGAVVLAARTRATHRARPRRSVVQHDEPASAAQLRAAAERALGEERYSEATVGAFRALAVRQHERGRLQLLDDATAGDIATELARAFPEYSGAISDGARAFDEVQYGEHPVGRARAADLLRLDDDLARA